MNTFSSNLVGIQSVLYGYAYQLTKDKDSAKDLLQETNLTALSHQSKFADGGNFRGWAITIMRNLFINELRLLRNQKEIATDNIYNFDRAQKLATTQAEAEFDFKQAMKAANLMPKGYKKVYCMYLSGFKYHEIAERLHIPLGTVKSRICYTKKHIINYLELER